MFGYVKPVPSELLVKEYDFYRATYCGICRSMKKNTGFFSNCALAYDAVFLALVRMVFLPDSDISAYKGRCIAHPAKPRPILAENGALTYTARVFALLTYDKLMDDMNDEPVGVRLLLLPAKPVLASAGKKADLPGLAEVFDGELKKIREYELSGAKSPDDPADAFGRMLGAAFAEGLSEGNATVTREIGFHLGRFIYCADAAEDFEKDRAAGNYNPYVAMYGDRPLTEAEKGDIRNVLLFEINKIILAVNLLPFGNRRILEHLITNISQLGLEKRIAFLNPKSDEISPEEGEKI